MFHIFILSLVVTTVVCAENAKFEKLTEPISHGEGPHWSDVHQALYWVDIDKGDIWRYHPESKNITTCHLGGIVTVIVPVDDTEDTFIITVKEGLQQLTWDGKNDSTTAVRPLISVGPLKASTRFNDGKADDRGRLWIGTIGPEENNTVEENVAKLYMVQCVQNVTDLQVSVAQDNVTNSNGLAWSADGAIMYYIDTPTKKIDAFDFNAENGTIGNRRTVFDLPSHNITGLPDGMTIDADDNLWIALYLGGGIIQVNPHLGRLLQTFPLEGVEKVTSVAWGDKELDALYVTTSSRGGNGGGELYKLGGTGAHGKKAYDVELHHCEKTDDNTTTNKD